MYISYFFFFFFQAEDGIRDAQESRGLGDVYKRQVSTQSTGITNILAMVRVPLKIHDVTYDIGGFSDHPGGSQMLLWTAWGSKGVVDATALFESYHSLKNRATVLKRLQQLPKIEPVGAVSKLQGSSHDGIYNDIIQRVREQFGALPTKSTAEVWLKVCGFVLTASLLTIWAHSSFCAGVAVGFCNICLGFILFHDSSHAALFSKPSWNTAVSQFMGGLILFPAHLWFHHHVRCHHSSTNVPGVDPDTTWSVPLGLTFRGQCEQHAGALAVLMHLLLPGLWVENVLGYWFHPDWAPMFICNSAWWSLFTDPAYALRFAGGVGVLLSTIVYTLVASGSLVFLCGFVCGLNLAYGANIMANHHSARTWEAGKEILSRGGVQDWAELQIRHSANFCGSWTCFFFGGINFQIEHHLFPNVCHVHYPRLSHIVRQACKDHCIPYTHFPSYQAGFESCASNYARENRVRIQDNDKYHH
eukprot:TRINITY_DN13419_c0_g2_i2.p1 TRINITY_DN13419_c0_g2~~TRINITY_DN13419_c0_g2_i2.p1  ORF type:complete len:472 (-),score=56.48 TRINITY_DN13419_c0_g2_i2:73-1488(-)